MALEQQNPQTANPEDASPDAAQTAEQVDAAQSADQSEGTSQQEPEQGQDRARPHMIPKYRYDAARARERQLAEELETLREQLEKAGVDRSDASGTAQAVQEAISEGGEAGKELEELSRKHAEAILNGDIDEAARLQAEIVRKSAAAAAPTEKGGIDSEQVVKQAVQQFQLQQTVSELEAAYPVLDPDSDKFDQDLSEKVIMFYEGLTLKGLPPAAALAEAAETVLAAAGLLKDSGQQSVSMRGVAERANAAANTPPALTPSVGSAGSSSEPTLEDLQNMSAEEWEALPESTRRKLMGLSS